MSTTLLVVQDFVLMTQDVDGREYFYHISINHKVVHIIDLVHTAFVENN